MEDKSATILWEFKEPVTVKLEDHSTVLSKWTLRHFRNFYQDYEFNAQTTKIVNIYDIKNNWRKFKKVDNIADIDVYSKISYDFASPQEIQRVIYETFNLFKVAHLDAWENTGSP